MLPMARPVRVPPSTLWRRGVTPVAHARNMRLDAARVALQATGCSVAEAARLHGFGWVTTFSLEYRRRFGAPPSALARKARAAG
jgi:transcriptional regulator GlxA family with amidase domain